MKGISIVPDRPECPDCGRKLEMGWTYDASQFGYVSSWKCPDRDGCGHAEYREREGGEVEVVHTKHAPPRVGGVIRRAFARWFSK